MNIKKYIIAFYYEIVIKVKSTLRYRFGVISDFVVFSIFMAFFMNSNVGISFANQYKYENYKALTLLGYIAWTVSVAAISSSTNEISTELNRGTFYRKLNSICSIRVLLFADMIASMIVEMTVFLSLLIIAHIVWGVNIPFKIISIVAIIICTLGMYGIGLILSGMAIRLKRIGSIVLLVQTGLLFVTDTIPTNMLITKITSIIPLTCCNMVMRLNISNQECIKELLWLSIISLFWFGLGNTIFDSLVKSSKKKGNLLHC